MWLLLVLLGGCATNPPQEFWDFDETHSFVGYQTFSWISDKPMALDADRRASPLLEQHVKKFIQAELTDKGFTFQAAREEADFVVGFALGSREYLDIETREVVDYYGPHWTWGHGYHGFVRADLRTSTEYNTVRYAEGSLTIDIFDVAKKMPVWHGLGVRRYDLDELGEVSEIERGVKEILNNFPPSENDQ